MFKLKINGRLITGIVLLLIISSAIAVYWNVSQGQLAYQGYHLENNSVIVKNQSGSVKFSGFSSGAIEVEYIVDKNLLFKKPLLPSFAKQDNLSVEIIAVVERDDSLQLTYGALQAIINKVDLSVSFYRNQQLLTRQSSAFFEQDKRGFNFELDNQEKILGGGERVLGMNRRGNRMPLYNKAHYGYTTESNQMYFGLPLIMSDKKYAILFDNSASGFLDIGHSEANTLTFEAIGGRAAYIVFTADSYPQLLNQYVDVTGKQPLPPRWAFGNYASRFGYKTEQQVRETVDLFIQQDFPLDALILDLYWFGPEVKGHVGNLDWDKNSFPTPIKMIEDLKQLGVKTILITEPFILSSSSKWQDAVDSKILAKDQRGDPKRFDFYFGNTGLIDVFDDNAQHWFGDIYSKLTEQGVAGVWGDLGEPEVHPDDALHYFSDIQSEVRGDEVHNAYGHQWAKMVYENLLNSRPSERPFIMMRSGFAGSQRYGMIPWTGDVSRSWDGLKPQVELSLQMGLSGMGYTHSDLGGFAGGEVFDQEMYIRWLQYGVFQPVFRPHAQDNIAPEPVFHDQQTQDIIRQFVKLRYQLLPYNYTLAYQNSTTGMPLMRPLFFEDESDKSLFDIKDEYLWGEAFLVSPIVKPNETEHLLTLPHGVWFDYWSEVRYLSDKSQKNSQQVSVPVSLQTLPIMVRAGSFIPMIDSIQTTRDYSSSSLILHYYADESVSSSQGFMYEDDGKSFASIQNKQYEKIIFNARHALDELDIGLMRKGSGYQGMPKNRDINLIVHQWKQPPQQLLVGDQLLVGYNSLAELKQKQSGYYYDQQTLRLSLIFKWDHQSLNVKIK